MSWIHFVKEAQAIVESKPTYKRFIDGTPLSNDIAVWMADFAESKASTTVMRQPLTSEDIFDLAMSVFTRIQKDDWVATDKDIYDFVRSIERAHGIGGSDG